ncbi:MAG: flagellar basal body rod protein FlgC [Bryobacterales bacterium]|nr:flagellar basal body rod protein FlgC [Bryobacterales bacterium]
MSLFHLLSIPASGMAAQRQRAELLVENLANAETTRTIEGGPYRRRDVVFESESQGSPFSAVYEEQLAKPATGVKVSEVVVDERDPELRYQPGHPDARPDGYVAYPRIQPAEDMADLMSATRGYQANVSAMTAIKDMLQRSIDLMR